MEATSENLFGTHRFPMKDTSTYSVSIVESSMHDCLMLSFFPLSRCLPNRRLRFTRSVAVKQARPYGGDRSRSYQFSLRLTPTRQNYVTPTKHKGRSFVQLSPYLLVMRNCLSSSLVVRDMLFNYKVIKIYLTQQGQQ